MRDFTLETYRLLLSGLRNAGYAFFPFEAFLTCEQLPEKVVILRHDVDKKSYNALRGKGIEYWRRK